MIEDRFARFRRDGPRRGGIDSVLLRQLPHDSVMHRLGVATKLVGLVVLSVATGINTGWGQLAALAIVVALAIVAARVPWRARPRLPTAFWLAIAVGLVLSANGLGAGRFVRLVAFSLLFMVLSLVIAWTTKLADIAPVLRTLGAPLRRLGLPIDEWAITTALAIRCLPLMLDECRTVVAARRQRPIERHPGWVLTALVDLITASTTAAIRRATDLGEVIALRGGPTLPQRQRQGFHVRDLAALLLIGAASVVPSLLS